MLEENSQPIQLPMCSATITKLAKAMLKVQAAIGPASKDNYNEFTKSKYATLNSVMDSCMEILTINGIWVTQYPVEVSAVNQLGLVTKLVHVESGEWQSSLLVMPLQSNNPQGYGSAMTYARRYGLSAMVGIVTEDDDGNMACNNKSKGIVQQPFNQGAKEVNTSATLPQNHPQQTSAPNNSSKQLPVSAQVSTNNKIGESLPRIDGVAFQQLTAGNGAPYIIATGQTRGKSPMLKSAGFSWDSSGKKWWKYAS